MIIKPIVGRKIWYSPCPALDDPPKIGEQPYDATIVYVWSDKLVNLRVTDHCGNTFARGSVTLLQEGDAPNSEGGHCYWMPYQKGQAAKTDEVAEIAATVRAARAAGPEVNY